MSRDSDIHTTLRDIFYNNGSGTDSTSAADGNIVSDGRADSYMASIPHRYGTAEGGGGGNMDEIAEPIIVLYNRAGINDAVIADYGAGIDDGTWHNHTSASDYG